MCLFYFGDLRRPCRFFFCIVFKEQLAIYCYYFIKHCQLDLTYLKSAADSSGINYVRSTYNIYFNCFYLLQYDEIVKEVAQG